MAQPSAIVRAAAQLSAPPISMVTNLERPSPSFATWMARSRMRSCKAAPNASRRRSPASATGCWPRFAAAPVANSRQVSLVEVSPSMVMQLKVVCTCLRQQALQRRLRDGRVGEDEAEHGRHVGRDHAGALAEAVDDDRHATDLDRARRELGVGVGGHDRARRDLEGVGLGRLGEPVEQMRELARIERLADDARRGDEDLARRCSPRPWRPPPP